ncbi:MAG: hypothetical protein ACPHL6_04145, partial [Rubripirellula sp.]
ADAASAADAADDERLADADADADAVAGARGHGQGRLAAASSTGSDDLAGSRRRCRLVAEVRMGKIAEIPRFRIYNLGNVQFTSDTEPHSLQYR